MTTFIIAKQTTANQWVGIGNFDGETARDAIRIAAEQHPDSDRFIASPQSEVVYDRVTRRSYVVDLESDPLAPDQPSEPEA